MAEDMTQLNSLWEKAVKTHEEQTGVNLRDEKSKEGGRQLRELWKKMIRQGGNSDNIDNGRPEAGDDDEVNRLLTYLIGESEGFKKARFRGDTLSKVGRFFGKYIFFMKGAVSIAGEGANIVFPAASIITIAVTYTLGTCEKLSDSLNSIESLFETMSSFARRLALLKSTLSNKHLGEYTDHILNVFTSILEFCTYNHQCLKNQHWKSEKWVKMLFQGGDAKLKGAFDRVFESISALDSATMFQTLASVIRVSDKIDGFEPAIKKLFRIHEELVEFHREVKQQNNLSRGDQRLNQENGRHPSEQLGRGLEKFNTESRKFESLAVVTESLSSGAENIMMRRLMETDKTFVKDTFEWVDDKSDYIHLKTTKGGVLLITGESGMGKSSISFSIWTRLLAEFEDDRSTSVVYFAFERDIEVLQSIENMLSCCASQVTKLETGYRSEVRDMMNEPGWKANLWESLFLSKFDDASRKGRRLFMILDGIDQLEHEEQCRLLDHLRTIEERDIDIRVVLTGTTDVWKREHRDLSGQWPDEKLSFHGLRHFEICLDRQNLREDFQRFAEVRIESFEVLSNLQPGLKRMVIEQMRDYADSVFAKFL